MWMKQESDTVQALGMAYAERETIEACYRVIQEVPNNFSIPKHVTQFLSCVTR